MADSPHAPRREPSPGLIRTLNNTGFMNEFLDSCSQAFVDFAAARDDEALDMGCAFGVASLAALAKGARVLACDIEPRHLDILITKTPANDLPRLRTQSARLPDADFPAESFGAILCSRVLHFLKGPEIETVVAKFHAWLKPGGKLFLITDTPYGGYWRAHAPIYEDKKRAGDPWPGFIPDTSIYLANASRSASFLNPCDPDILTRVCGAAGLTVESAAFIGRKAAPDHEPEPGERSHAAVIARKDER